MRSVRVVRLVPAACQLYLGLAHGFDRSMAQTSNSSGKQVMYEKTVVISRFGQAFCTAERFFHVIVLLSRCLHGGLRRVARRRCRPGRWLLSKPGEERTSFLCMHLQHSHEPLKKLPARNCKTS